MSMSRLGLLLFVAIFLVLLQSSTSLISSPSSIINPSKVKQVSAKPRAFVYEGFLTDLECDHLISLAKENLQRSAVADNDNGESQVSDVRTSSGTFISKGKDPIVSGIEDKLSTWTFLPKENGEDLQVLRYEPGQKYDAHFDYFHDKVNIARGGHRIATVLLYLSNVTKGGETVFPDAQEYSRRSLSENKDDLSDCAKKGIAVKPKKGNALLFFNLQQDAIPDPFSLHGGCPVIEGEKWSATKWIHVDSFDKILTHDGNCTDVNESCERWAVLGECGKNPEYMVGTPELPGNCRHSWDLFTHHLTRDHQIQKSSIISGRSRVMDSKLENADDENSMMEISEENESRKRKADDTFPVDSSDVGEKEEQVDDEDITISEEEKMDVSSREEGQEWDVDSFDVGHQYTTKKKVDPNDEEAVKMRRYRLQMYQTNGFNVDMENYPGRVAYRELWAVDLDEPFRSSGLTGRAYMQNCVDLAIQRYNRINQKTLTCEHIVRAIICVVDGIKSYITFMARETPDGNLVEYQAKTEKKFWQKHAHALFCRPTPIPKVIQVPKDEDCDPICDGSSRDGSSRESDQEWDVDSLDDESDYKPPDMLAPTDEEIEKMRLYRPHMYRSKGFYVDGESYSGKVVYFSQVVLDEPLWLTGITGREYVQRMIDLSLEKYNEIKGSSVTCESIVRAILTRVTGFKMYITFMARESPGGDLVEYQAKTERKVWQKKTHVIFCRPTPKSKD